MKMDNAVDIHVVTRLWAERYGVQFMTGAKDFSLLQNDQINPGVHLPPIEEKLQTIPRGYSGRVTKPTNELHLLEEYLVQRSVENTYYTINDHLAVVLQTMGLPRDLGLPQRQ
jgi:hypothetical protein